MVSYADYPSTMPPADFDLYPSQDTYADMLAASQPFMPSNTYLDGSYTSYDSHPPMPVFSNQHTYPLDHTIKQQYSESDSPASHSFECPPPHLSTASESGASAQSTSSSAMGSPSMNPNYQQDSWATMGAGLGLAPGIVQADSFVQEPFVTSGFETEGILAPEKLSGCVGESTHFSSSAQSGVSAFDFALHSNTYPGALAQERVDLFPEPTFSGAAFYGSPMAFPTSPVTTSTGIPGARNDSLFKSPGAPSKRSSPSSPFMDEQASKRHQSITTESAKRRRASLSPNAVSPKMPNPPVSSESQNLSPVSHHQSFYSQSSGLYIPPLGSSCLSPLFHYFS